MKGKVMNSHVSTFDTMDVLLSGVETTNQFQIVVMRNKISLISALVCKLNKIVIVTVMMITSFFKFATIIFFLSAT